MAGYTVKTSDGRNFLFGTITEAYHHLQYIFEVPEGELVVGDWEPYGDGERLSQLVWRSAEDSEGKNGGGDDGSLAIATIIDE